MTDDRPLVLGQMRLTDPAADLEDQAVNREVMDDPALDHIAQPLRHLAVPVSSLNLDPANARKHDEKNLAAIKGSLARWGQRFPIVVQRQGSVVRAGNGRVLAARELGWTHVAALVVDETDVEAVAFALADNRTSELAEWDDEALARLLESLPDDAFAATGFGDDDLSELLDQLAPATVEEDEVPALLPDPISRRGDLWLMGEHKLLVGDSTSSADVRRLMGRSAADLVLTDPPYGVSYVGKTGDALVIENDGEEGLEELLRGSLGLALKVCKPGAVWYVAAPAGPQFAAFSLVLGELGIWRQTLAWIKDSMVLGHSDYHYRHEALFYGWAPGAEHRGPPDRTRTSVLEFDRPKASREHPTMKPLALWAELMGNSTGRGDLVYDPFAGSGTSIVAAEQLGRSCYAVELEPRYADVAVRRWRALSGNEAVLDGDGRGFEAVEAERSAREKAPESSGAEGPALGGA
jgi:site-specific DNA-methyltransferase (adenine-specific)